MRSEIEKYKEVAIMSYGEKIGSLLWDSWQAHNRDYWQNKLNPGPMVLGLTGHGAAMGLYTYQFNKITVHASLFFPKSESPWGLSHQTIKANGFEYAKDVILHEMIHQYLHQFHGDEYKNLDSHNCFLWCDEINRISKAIGLNCKAKPEIVKRVEGKVKRFIEPGYLKRKEIAGWPHCLKSYGLQRVTN